MKDQLNPASVLELESRRLEALPLVNHFLGRLDLERLLAARLPAPDSRCQVPTVKVLLVLLRNLILSRRPLYSLAEWANQWAPQVLGLGRNQLQRLNDERLGRALDELFASDRQTLLTEFVLRMVREFQVDLSQLHNDSTSLSFPRGSSIKPIAPSSLSWKNATTCLKTRSRFPPLICTASAVSTPFSSWPTWP
jgi:hypothetical protein